MNQFITFKKQKEIPDCTGREKEVQVLSRIIDSCGSICIYGESGVGKTHLVERVLHGKNFIELTPENNKPEFLQRLAETKTHVLIDDSDIPSTPISKGSLLVISRKIIEGFDYMEIKPLSVENLSIIGKQKFPKVSQEVLEKFAKESKGNIRNFLYSLDEFDCVRDFFKTSKELVHDLVCKDHQLDPRSFIGKPISEHGHSWGIIHENYPDSKVLDIHKLATISELMSIADIKDEEMYAGYSQCSIFSFFGILYPAILLDHSLDRSKMRPGSFWTKYNNFKMRHNRYKSLTNRKFKTVIDIDALFLFTQYCRTKPSSEVLPILKEYGFESADMDMMNHIALENKIKTRTLQTIKKQIKGNE